MFQTTNKLDFETAQHPLHGNLFRVGTCHGQWGVDDGCYYILSVVNESQGNGHLNDVFEWFEHSCRRDERNLVVLEIMNKRFYQHLINKRGFVGIDVSQDHAIKVFNSSKYAELLKSGNEILDKTKFL